MTVNSENAVAATGDAASPAGHVPAVASDAGIAADAGIASDAAMTRQALEPELRPWRAFLTVNARVRTALERDLLEQADLPMPWYDVLLQLAESPDRQARMADLAVRVLLSRSGLTRLVDRLEYEGLVSRQPSPGDARGIFTVLTDSGYRRLREATPVHVAGIRSHFLSHLDEQDRADLERVLNKIVAQFEVPGELS